MNIKNQYKYPEAVVKAVENEIYKPNIDVWRATELIDSPLVKRLLIKHWDDIEVDVDDYVYSSLFGTAWHKFLSKWEVEAMIENRWNIVFNKIPITGQTDIYKMSDGIIEDNKVTSAFAWVFGNIHWTEQLNIYATLIEHSGYPVKKLFINAFLRDWSRYEAMKGHNSKYPKHKFHKVKIPLWSRDRREAFLNSRIQLHLNGADYICSPEERWEKETTWAVKKKGTKKARRVLDTKEAAEKWIIDKKPKGDVFIEERKGECTRCKLYCSARTVCPYKEK